MPYMYSEMQNKLSKTRDILLESMGQIISSRCPSIKTIQRKCYKATFNFGLRGGQKPYLMDVVLCVLY